MVEKDPALFLHAIERRYHQGEATLEILNRAELAVWSGQSVALIGPSGAGKSTLLHIAGLLEHADGGEVYVDGVATSDLSDAERTRIRRTDIGFVYQFHHLLPDFDARENVILPQVIHGAEPDAPTMASRSPASTARSMPSSTGTGSGPVRYVFLSPRHSSTLV